MSRFDAARTTEVPEGTWTVPNEREANVVYQHSVWNVDYSKIDAVIIDGVRFSAERTCRIVKTWSDSDYVDDWNYRCSECRGFIPINERDPETGDVISAANYCPNCGAKVVEE